jgi:hypothetical protein
MVLLRQKSLMRTLGCGHAAPDAGSEAMPSARQTVQIYEELAELEGQHEQPQLRDRFLILAADAALKHGLHEIAERLRARLLEHNPHHLLRPYPSLLEAVKSPDVAGYIADLRHTYPPEEAFRLLVELTTDGAVQRDVPESKLLPRKRTQNLLEPEPAQSIPEPPIIRFAPRREEPAPQPEPKLAEPRPNRTPRLASPPLEESEPPLVEPTEVYPYPPPTSSPPPRATQAADPDEAHSVLSVWVSTTLFGILLLASLALLVWTFARLFLPL